MATDKKPTKAEAAAKKTYKVIGRLDHDGESFDVGDTVDLTDKQAAPLIGTAVEAPPAESADKA